MKQQPATSQQQAMPPARKRPGHPARSRELERSVALTGPERLRARWYRIRLTIAEMNAATRRLTELQARLP